MIHIHQNLEEIRSELIRTAESCGRPPEDVRLVAVSKTYPTEAVMTAYAAGQRMFGENRVQELETKVSALPNDIEWHLIGHLQSNKVGKAVVLAQWIHAVDSIALIERIDRLAGDNGTRPKILIEVNISGEQSKEGIASSEVETLIDAAIKCKHLELKGFMTMAPFDAEDAELHAVFGGLRRLRDAMAAKFGIALPELSMGMSGDYHIAIAEGATMVRIGTAIFGVREG